MSHATRGEKRVALSGKVEHDDEIIVSKGAWSMIGKALILSLLVLGGLEIKDSSEESAWNLKSIQKAIVQFQSEAEKSALKYEQAVAELRKRLDKETHGQRMRLLESLNRSQGDAFKARDAKLAFQLAQLIDKVEHGALPPGTVNLQEVGASKVYLANLGPRSVQVYTDGYWGLGSHGFLTANSPARIAVAGKKFKHGLGMAVPKEGLAKVAYPIDRKFLRLTGGVAVNDTVEASAKPLTFSVVGDGKTLWRSKPVKKSGVLQEFDVNVRKVKELTLVVKAAGFAHDGHAVWLDPILHRE